MIKVLELYSGIGGFHFALQECQIPSEVVGAADINNIANSIYSHNFPSTKIIQRCIESLTVKELDKLSPDLIHMSPPCQPFVRVGNQKDAGDERTKSFLHLIDIIPHLKKRPKYLFLENVRGFDTSETRTVLLEMLKERSYSCQEFLLSPVQFGIPNSRLRYYLLAKLQPAAFSFTRSDKICDEIPACARPYLIHRRDKFPTESSSKSSGANTEGLDLNISQKAINSSGDSQICHNKCPTDLSMESSSDIHKCDKCNSVTNTENDSSKTRTCISEATELTHSEANCRSSDPDFKGSIQDNSSAANCDIDETMLETDEAKLKLYQKCHDVCRTVGEFLETGPAEYLEQFLVPHKFMHRFWSMDIIKPHLRNTCCFTKRYGHHIEGAGSVVQSAEAAHVDLTVYKRDRLYTEEVKKGVELLRLRFFSPREIANLMCFPPHFNFPPEITTKQCYRALGNSLNVHVVAVLLRILLDDVSCNNTPQDL